MSLYDNRLYNEDLLSASSLRLPWEKLSGKSIMLTGATGMIGSLLIDVIMKKNEQGLGCKVYALGRNREKAENRFRKHCYDPSFSFRFYDASEPFICNDMGKVDYILHLASNTHPVQYSTDPIGTITTNIIGLNNMLEFACRHNTKRFAFASSNEVYGENRGDTEFFDEKYCGYIDPNTMRAGYPESKRCGEALCQAYKAQKGLNVVIPRLTRTYGPTMLFSDTKAISQFIKKGVAGEDIVLKSAGEQYYSYMYALDSVTGLLTVLLRGVSGEAYNVADAHSDIKLKDLAKIIADICGKKVVFEIPDSIEKAGYSTATKARLDGGKLAQLGWKPAYDIRTGIERTISILKAVSDNK